MLTYYEILEVTPEASDEVIRAAYKSLVKKYHPDSGVEKDSEKFLQVEEAYATLADEQKRREYDEKIKRGTDSGNNEQSDALVKSNTDEVEDEDKNDRKERYGETFSSLLSVLFIVFIIACFVTNMEQYRMQLYNMIGRYEFNSEPGDHDVLILVKYNTALLKSTPKVWLNVDGQRVQVIKEGDTYEYDCKLSAGKHILFVETKTLHINSDIYTITVSPDSEITGVACTITGKWLGWGADFTVEETIH